MQIYQKGIHKVDMVDTRDDARQLLKQPPGVMVPTLLAVLSPTDL